MHIGLAGIGRMGEAIGLRLIECGHTLTVWNRTAAKTAALQKAGARLAASPAELARAADIVITILTDAAAIDAVYDGPDGLLAGAKDKVLIEMSTVLPEVQQALDAKVRAAGASLVECPVSGSVVPARGGKLLGMAAGDEAAVAKARPVLEQICRLVEHVGPVGSGATMKLAVNLPLMVYWQAFGEALAMCRTVKLDPDKLIAFFCETSGGTNVLKARGHMIANMLAGKDPGPPGADINLGRKDLRTMLAAAEKLGVEIPLIERTLACFEEAAANGWGERDNTVMPVYWRQRGKK